MALHYSLICFAILTYASRVYHLAAWWDEPHMIIGAIARTYMTPEQAEKIDGYLERWEEQYPTFNTIEMATIWPDHVKCKVSGAPGCDFFNFADDLTLFNHWHYEDKPYVVEPFTLPEYDIYTSYTVHGTAVWSLNEIIKNVEQAEKYPCTEESCDQQIGTISSWNFRIRMFCHIFGDLHQPDHSGSGWSKHFPDSDDSGGHFTSPDGMAFHSYMDAGGNVYTEPYPIMTVSKTRETAEKLLADFNAKGIDVESYLNATKPEDIINETFERLTTVYDAIQFKDIVPGAQAFWPEGFEEEVRELCNKQIVAAGRRLAEHLKRMADAMPPLSLNPKKNCSSNSVVNSSGNSISVSVEDGRVSCSFSTRDSPGNYAGNYAQPIMPFVIISCVLSAATVAFMIFTAITQKTANKKLPRFPN